MIRGAESDPAVLVEARDLSKVFRVYHKQPGVAGAVRGLFRRSYSEMRAVDSVNFSVREGECVGFLGPNGAGKTTVLKMLSGLVQPTAGDASVLGYRPWERRDAMKRQFALLMGQKNSLWWDLPARESLELNRVIYGIAPRVFGEVVEELTALLDVKDKMDVVVRELSLGERMKMELIAALLHAPRVLFLDEPTIGLDVTSQRRVRSFLKSYGTRRKIAILLTSHYMGDIEALCRRVILIDHGKLFFDGPLAEVVDRFGAHKILTLTFARETQGNFDSMGEVLEVTPVSVRVRVARHRVAEVCREALASWPVTDLAVQESSVEEVMRQLFDLGAQRQEQPGA
jgi:ABC-2 type transport system ATP-binding protein